MDHEVFEAHRRLLFSIAYRMLGSAAEAEDVVQDVYLRARDARDVRDAKAFLVTAVTRLSIDRLRSARVKRETYVGPWLPEPLAGEVDDPAEAVEGAESLSLAFLVVLEALSPKERAAFLLHDVFGFGYGEVGDALGGTTEPAARQLAHRARRAVAARRTRFAVSREEHHELLQRFLAACSGHDLEGLVTMLSEDAVAFTDGGGEVQAARRPVRGRRRVARLLVYLAERMPAAAAVEVVPVNGRDGVVLFDAGVPMAVLDLVCHDGLVERVHIVAAPSKLGGVRPAVATG